MHLHQQPSAFRLAPGLVLGLLCASLLFSLSFAGVKEDLFLRKAAANGDLDKVKQWIKQGGDPSATDSDGKNALDIAVDNGRDDVVKFLKQKLGGAPAPEEAPKEELKEEAPASAPSEDASIADIFGLDATTAQKAVADLPSVKIGSQVWAIQNSDSVPTLGKSWCYDESDANCKTYGRLYDWEAAMSICPVGWHLPSDAEWNALAKTVGGLAGAGRQLKAKKGWSAKGTDAYGFSALPGGGYLSGDHFGEQGKTGYWWGSTEYSGAEAFGWIIDGGKHTLRRNVEYKSLGFSVRCIKD